ncbi:MAG: YciI family protein [Balneolales bacterium]
MKFMMFMIPKVYQPGTPADEQAGEGFAPPAEAVKAMMKYNEELAEAGALISLDGLHPLANGAHVSFKGEKPTVIDGPFIETKEVIGGYWVIDVNSKDEAIEWARKCPANKGDVIEIRQIFGEEDFPEDVGDAADNPAVKEAIERGKAKQ